MERERPGEEIKEGDQKDSLHQRVEKVLKKAREHDNFQRENRGGELPEIFADIDREGFVSFGVISHGLMNKQSQYARRYLNEKFSDEYPYLGEDIRLKGDLDDYHAFRIHKDDIEEFVERYEKYMKKIGAM